MSKPNYWFVKTSLFLLSSLVLANSTQGQATATPVASPEPDLYFWARPHKQLFAQGESVVFVLSIYTRSAEPIFVSRRMGDEFVDLNVIGPDGKQVPWLGKGRIVSKEYSSDDFAVLGTYQEISAKRTISLKDGAGFVLDKPGEYFVTTEYSLGPPEHFAPFAGKTKIPTGSFHYKTAFCIEACIREPHPVRSNASRSAIDAVHLFYTYLAKYRPIGIPSGPAKRALWPLLSKRLVQELDSLQACDNDYYRRYSEILRKNQYKPATPWLEDGLFSGPNEAASPMKFSILDSRAIGENRVDVRLRFTIYQVRSEDYEGIVTVIPENNRWVVDDFVWLGGNDELLRLSDGYRGCKEGQWVGEVPY